MFQSHNDNLLTRLNPLVKVLMLGAAAMFAFFISDIGVLAIASLVAVLAIRILHIDFGRTAMVIRLFIAGAPMLMAIFVLSWLWKEPTLAQGALTGLTEGARYSLRFLLLILVNFAVVLSTDPRDIIRALKALRFPDILSRIFAHVINLMPRLVEEIQYIFEAQRARGMRLMNLWRPSHWLPVALPVIMASMRYSEQTAISMELRGGPEEQEEILPPFTAADWITSAFCIILITTGVIAYYFPEWF